MRHLNQRCKAVDSPRAYLRLDFDARQKVRSRAVATNGEVVGIHIPRGTSLKDGECLESGDGEVFMVRAAGEPVSIVSSNHELALTRAAYHLGNRHVRLQIEPGRISYQCDHVLDDMLRQLGFSVEQGVLPFEPEPGAYHRHGSRTGHHHHATPHDHHHSHSSDDVDDDHEHHSHDHDSGQSHARIASHK